MYALCEPVTGEVRYIGYSQDPAERHGKHLRDRSKTYKCHWIKKLLRSGLAPQLRVMCVVEDAAEAKRVEVALIAMHRRRGARLTNGTSGGDGLVEPTAEVRAKMSAAQMGNSKCLGFKHSEETRAKLRGNQNAAGHVHTGEWKARISAKLKGRGLGVKASDETRRKLSESHLGKIPWNKGKLGTLGAPCAPDCTCGRHRVAWNKGMKRSGTPCPPGCSCGKHKDAWNKGHRGGVKCPS